MMSPFARAACAALCALALPAAAAGAEPHPEALLLAALDDLYDGRTDAAWETLDRLVRREPNFRLARLFHRELEAARAGAPTRDLASVTPVELDELIEEARLRLQAREQVLAGGAAPDAILQLSDAHRHAVVVDLSRARLYLLENEGGALRVVRDYYASIGKRGWGKQRSGDNRTPVGVYHVTGYIRDRALPELYGAGAFPVSYPNAWDRRLRRPGSGIWVHGVPRDTYVRAPRSSEGCVTLANADLMDLKPFLVEGRTPVVFADALEWRPQAEGRAQRDEFLAQLEAWRARRSARASIDVRLEDVDLFRYPGGDGLMLARFTQHERGGGGTRTSAREQFWRRSADGRWQIVRETGR